MVRTIISITMSNFKLPSNIKLPDFKLPSNFKLPVSLSRNEEKMIWGAVAAVASTAGLYIMVRRQRQKRRNGAAKEGEENSRGLLSSNDTATFITPTQAMALICQRRSIFPKQYSPDVTVPRNVLDDMLEAARWAPSHHVTQPWHFVIFETLEQRVKLGHFLANQYKMSTEVQDSTKEFSAKKYSKKIANAGKASYIIAVCVETDTRNPVLEEVCSVACAVQNMHLVASAHKVAAYWSTSSIISNKVDGSHNPSVLDFLELSKNRFMCLGWMFVGGYGEERNWPKSIRGPVSQQPYGGSYGGAPIGVIETV